MSSPPNAQKKKVTLIKTENQLKEDNESLTSHIQSLIESKFNVIIPDGDIQFLNHLPNGSVMMRIMNRRPGSAWEELLNAIKSGMNSEVNLYANFHFTRRRNALLYEIRVLKREGKVHKYFSDENGSISFRTKEKGFKQKVTYFVEDPKNNKFGQPKTLTKDELLEYIRKMD